MAYTAPTFNLKANIWNQHDDHTGPPDLTDIDCQLYFPKQDQLEVTPGQTFAWRGPMYIRFPAGTDVRFQLDGSGFNSWVECPAGTGRFYGVCYVDDAHKGFPNEYRVAVVQWSETPPFPLP